MGMVESIENNTKNINAPKKRGRKPKNKINEHKIPKKRGRKPKEVKDINNNVNLFDSADIKDSIIHLKTNSNNINDNLAFDSILKYNPNILDSVPVPYDPDFNNIDYETLDTNNNKINNIIKRYNETTNVSVLNYNIQKKNISPIMVYSNDNNKDIWERYSLLNYLYSIIFEIPELIIKLAAPRLALKSFGGKLSIEEFRQ